MNSFNFCFSRNLFISPSILNTLPCRVLLVRSFGFVFSFRSFVFVSAENFADNLIGREENSLVHVLVLLLRFLVFNFWQFDYNVFWCRSFGVHLIWNSLGFLNLYVCVLLQVTNFHSSFLSIHFMPLSLSPFYFWDA